MASNAFVTAALVLSSWVLVMLVTAAMFGWSVGLWLVWLVGAFPWGYFGMRFLER